VYKNSPGLSTQNSKGSPASRKGLAIPAVFRYHNGTMAKKPSRQEITAQLQHNELDALGVAGWPAVRVLVSLLCSADAQLRLAAARALGRVSALLAEKEPEKVRDLLRRLFWSTNDESGASGLGVPEAIAEIIAARPDLWAEYVGPLLVLLDEPGLATGTLAAARRLAGAPLLLPPAQDALSYLARSPDPAVRARAREAAGYLGLAQDGYL